MLTMLMISSSVGLKSTPCTKTFYTEENHIQHAYQFSLFHRPHVEIPFTCMQGLGHPRMDPKNERD